MEADGTLAGLKKLLGHDYTLNNRLRELAQLIAQKAAENRASRDKEKDRDKDKDAEVVDTELLVPKVFKSSKDIDLLIDELKKVRSKITSEKHARIHWKEID
jgi:hypothetical protein